VGVWPCPPHFSFVSSADKNLPNSRTGRLSRFPSSGAARTSVVGRPGRCRRCLYRAALPLPWLAPPPANLEPLKDNRFPNGPLLWRLRQPENGRERTRGRERDLDFRLIVTQVASSHYYLRGKRANYKVKGDHGMIIQGYCCWPHNSKAAKASGSLPIHSAKGEREKGGEKEREGPRVDLMS
jgi:hypothetical protein